MRADEGFTVIPLVFFFIITSHTVVQYLHIGQR